MKRTIALLGTGALLMATAAGAQTRTTGSGIRVTKDVPAATTTPSTTSMSPGEVALGTEFNLAAYANLNEKNITAIMAGGDSLEIQMSELALSKATSERWCAARRSRSESIWIGIRSSSDNYARRLPCRARHSNAASAHSSACERVSKRATGRWFRRSPPDCSQECTRLSVHCCSGPKPGSDVELPEIHPEGLQ